jgi:uncharacterized repeat protein (TIGR02543 family)/LPXTG-motif cell wall-anchored protein
MTKLFKALGATLLAAGLVLAGISGAVSTAQAASMTSFTATTTGTLAAGQVISNDIIVTFTAPTAIALDMNNRVQIKLTNTTGFGADSACGARVTVVENPSLPVNCRAQTNAGSSYVYLMASGLPGIAIGANSTYTFTIAGGTLTQTAAGPIAVNAITQGISGGVPTTFDTSTIDLTSGPASATVTFDANGGSGSMSTQTSSSAITLTPNAFSRTDYNFAGWNTAANGSGTEYADAVSYPFTASETLYAQWTPILANTGIDAKPYLYGGLALAIVGSALLLIARRKQTN